MIQQLRLQDWLGQVRFNVLIHNSWPVLASNGEWIHLSVFILTHVRENKHGVHPDIDQFLYQVILF